jgi:hypothetical protein
MSRMQGGNIRPLRRPESDLAAPGRRWKTDWPAQLSWVAQHSSCTVLNISSWGAQLRLEHSPDPGERVRLTIDGIGSIPAKVVWRRGDTAGVQFLEQQTWIRRLHTQRLDPATWGRGSTLPHHS